MANTLLTPTAVTREAMRVLHNKLVFARRVNRQYDDQFAQSGAKIGSSLKIRLPNQYTVRTGKTIDVQDTAEDSVTLTVGTQKGVDMSFSSNELTLSIDDFSSRILEPAMARLAAEIDKDGLAEYANVYNLVGTAGQVPNTALVALQAQQKLDEYLAPDDGNRAMVINPAANANMVDALKALFQSAPALSDQYETGRLGKDVLGFDWYRSALVNTHTNSAGVTSGITVNGANQTGSSVTINTSTTAYATGTVVTFAGCYAVNPETKQTYSHLQQFVVGSGSTATSLNISPSIVTTGATQNVSASPTDTGAVTVVGSASTGYAQNLAFHKDAFVLASADLVMPKGVDFAAREVYDGISMRIIRDYDVNNDNFPCRIDVLYGWKTVRPQLACRVTA